MRSRSSRVSARPAPAWPHTAVAVIGLVALGCSAPPGTGLDDDEVPEYQGPLPGMSSGQAPAQSGAGAMSPGAAGPSGATGSTGATGTTPSPTPSTNGGEQNPASGAPITPSAGNTGSNNGANAGTPNDGAGGASMVPPMTGNDPGAGGASMGESDPVTQPPVTPPPVTPPPMNPPAVTPPPVTPPVIDTDCPDTAFFCSGFEQETFPAGTVNIIGGSQFPDAFRLDRTQVNSGQQAFLLPLTNQAFSYRVMAIPVPVQAFWARIFVRTDTLFGDVDHDGLFAISSGDQTVDNNNETRIEFAEQEGTIVLNRSTDRITFPAVRPTTLSANTWHCVEARFDGGAGDVEVFANGQAIISALGDAQFQFMVRTFRIGTLQFHAPRNVWFDDVVLDTQRIGCD
jgi:hypothetical protein